MTIKQWVYNPVLLHLPQPHLHPGKNCHQKVYHFKLFEFWQERQNHDISDSLTEFSLSLGNKNTPSFVKGAEELKTWMEPTSSLRVCSKRICLKSLVKANICPEPPWGAKETISIWGADSKEKETSFLLVTALWHKLPQQQCLLSTFLYRLRRSW